MDRAQVMLFKLADTDAGSIDIHLSKLARPSSVHIRGKLKVPSVPDGFFIRETKLGGQEISPDDFEISASGQLEIVLSGMAATIGGSVHNADDEPFPNSTVTPPLVPGVSLGSVPL